MSADDDSFHPLGSEWESDLESMLEDTEYDTKLGMDMAEDAMRVTKGELSEAEFHEKYHEDVLEEFGVDDRPTEEAYEARESRLAEAMEKFDGDDEESRRDAMKKMGLGAAAVGFGAWASTDDGEPDVEPGVDAAATQEGDDEGTQLGMVVDLERCDGCLSCVVACSQENNLDQGVNWMYVLDWEDPDQNMNSGRGRLVRPCQHCTDAPCEKVCPTTARHTRSKDGLVLTDYDVCIGCRYCQVACPYGVNYFQWDEPDVSAEEIAEGHGDHDGDHIHDERGRPVDSRAPRGVMSKCTMCPTRQDGLMGEDKVGTTACEEACPPDAIQFGDMNDPDSDPQQYAENPPLARVKAMGVGDDDDELQEAVEILDGEREPADDDEGMTESEAQSIVEAEAGTVDSTFKLLEEVGTNPNVVYVGNQPGPRAEQVDGPVAYDEVGQTDRRKDVTDEETVGGGLFS